MLGVYRVFPAILYSSLSLWTLEVWLLTWNAMAQIQQGTVQGTVQDPSGAALPGASIALLQPISGSRRTALADRAGQFVFHQVPFGRYRMIVQAPGFQLLEKVVSIRSNLPVALQLKLRIYGSAETVTVEATQRRCSVAAVVRAALSRCGRALHRGCPDQGPSPGRRRWAGQTRPAMTDTHPR